MGNYIVSARKYRPGTFTSVVGQAHVTNTLKSAILMDQLAHAFLFSGPRGVGKTTCARILAKAINCENLQETGEPCNNCESCDSYNQGKSINIHELDAASNNSVDDIRNLIEQTRYVQSAGKKSVYIIDEVHMLSQAAFNAFLKTLEEPPEHVLFILATTEKHKILPTILSRCQKFDFRRIRVDDIAKHLEYISKEESIEYEYAALQQIALKADGALRDALSLYDQLVSYSTGALTFEAVLENLNILDYEYYFRSVDLIQEGEHGQLLLELNEIIEKGFEAKDFIVGLTEHFRNLLICQEEKTVKLLESSENVKQKYLKQSQALSPSFLLNAFQLVSEAEQQTKRATHPRLVVELVLIKLAHLNEAIRLARLSGTADHAELKEKKKLMSR
jgi:DNA polymerase-3 subunit gamma/tau